LTRHLLSYTLAVYAVAVFVTAAMGPLGLARWLIPAGVILLAGSLLVRPHRD